MKALSLTDVFDVGQLIAFASIKPDAEFNLQDKKGKPFDRDSYLSILRRLKETCEALGLPSTIRQIDRIVYLLDEADPTEDTAALFSAIKPDVSQLGTRFSEETNDVIAYHLSPQQHGLYNDPTKDWQAMLAAFPSILNDVQEMNRCFAIGRYTASVLHAMRILEPGLAALGREFDVSTNMNTWKTIIDRLRKAIEAKSIAEGSKWRDRDFYSDAATQIWFFKDAWRNHVMHARVTFDEETAEPIIEYTKRLMKHLATKLSE